MLSGIAFVLRKAPRTALALGVAVAVACPAVLVGDALPVGRNALGAVSVGAPTDLRVVPGNGTVTVAFTRPVLPTGVAVLDVAASFAPAGTSTWTAWRTPIVADPIAPVTFGGLTNGVALRMRVRLVTSVGAGAPGYVGTAFTPQAPLEIYVATDGRDTAPGTRAAPLRTIAAAWSRIPRGTTLSRPHTIVVFPGEYAASTMPHYWEWRRGTATAPITLRAEGTGRPVTLRGDLNLFEVHHLRVRGIRIAPGGDAVHCERCSFLTLDNVELDGGGSAWETLKVNQSSDITVRNSTLRGAGDNVIDFVAVQRGAIVGNVISGAGDWCAYVKGGSTRITVAGNEISHCGTGGFTAGQGTGLEFTVAPWTTYEATDIVFRGNHITDTEGAAFGVNGGRNIVFENNRAERVGRRSHLVEVTFGGRSCDGDRTRCTALLASGAWGTDVVGGDVYAHIPDRNVVIRGNTIVNPTGYSSQWQHFEVSSPRANGGVRVGPSPARTDDGLVITGNVIRNGPASMPLGIDGETVCAPTNPTCTIAVIYRDNDINGR